MGKPTINKIKKAGRKKKKKQKQLIDAVSSAVADSSQTTELHEFSVRKKKKRPKKAENAAEIADRIINEPKSVLELVDERLRVQPPFVRQKYQSSEHRRLDLSGFRVVLMRHAPAMADEDVAKRERYILRKLRYKMAGPFSHHKFWQAARSISCQLDKFVAEKPTHSLRQFANGIEVLSDDSLYCPSTDYLTFALCKLIRGAHLLVKTMELCAFCAEQTVGQMKYGHLISTNLILLTTAATVFRSVGSTLTFYCTLYDSSVKWHRSLLTVGQRDDRILPTLPEHLASLPSIAEGLRLFAIKADADQRKTHSDFVSELLRIEEKDLTLASNRFEIEKAAAATTTTTGSSSVGSVGRMDHTDMGTSVSRESDELTIDRSLLTQIQKWTSLSDVKKVYKQLKGAVDKRSVELARTMQRRWDSLLVLRRMKQHDRLTSEIAHLRSELVMHISGK